MKAAMVAHYRWPLLDPLFWQQPCRRPPESRGTMITIDMTAIETHLNLQDGSAVKKSAFYMIFNRQKNKKLSIGVGF